MRERAGEGKEEREEQTLVEVTCSIQHGLSLLSQIIIPDWKDYPPVPFVFQEPPDKAAEWNLSSYPQRVAALETRAQMRNAISVLLGSSANRT